MVVRTIEGVDLKQVITSEIRPGPKGSSKKHLKKSIFNLIPTMCPCPRGSPEATMVSRP